MHDRFLKVDATLGRANLRRRPCRWRPELSVDDGQQVGLNRRGDRDVPLTDGLDEAPGLVDHPGELHAKEVEPLVRTMLDDVANSVVDAGEEAVEVTSVSY